MSPSTASKVTTDHDEIRRWAEERGAKPAAVIRTEQGDDPGIIRLDFPGFSGAGSLQEIAWDEWFDRFDGRNLALLYQEQTANGERSNFNKIITRETAEEVESAVGGKARSASDNRSAGSATIGGGSRAVSRTSAGKTATSHGRERTAKASTSVRERSSSSGRAGTRSRSAKKRSSYARSGGASRLSKARTSRTTSRAGARRGSAHSSTTGRGRTRTRTASQKSGRRSR
ncbi:MAG TPA: hypothetical protein VL240_11335 [Candidatus Binatia bacterium]|nr:hypothetical protein [Candidatus Binatia bacterium]